MDTRLNQFYAASAEPDGDASPGSRLRRTSSDELIRRLMAGSAGMHNDRAAIGRELRARLGGVLLLSAQEAAAIDNMINGSATANDAALIRHALADVAYGDTAELDIVVGDSSSGIVPKPPQGSKPGRLRVDADAIAAASDTPAAQTERGNYRYVPTADLIRHFMKDRAGFSYIELDLMIDELSTRAGYCKDEQAAERLKWLGQLRWGLLSEENAQRLSGLLPRTAIEIMQMAAAGTKEIHPACLLASMELIARGAYGGWMAGHQLARCKFIIRKLLLMRARSGKSPVSAEQRSAIDAFVDASGPGRDAVAEWRAVAALL